MNLYVDSGGLYWVGTRKCGVVCLGKAVYPRCGFDMRWPSVWWDFQEAKDNFQLARVGKKVKSRTA